jgi:uncharacterized protein (TIGR00369 family)
VLPPIDPVPELSDDLPPAEPEPEATPDPYLRAAPAGIVPQEEWSRLSGAEVLAAQLSGELPAPPIHYLTGLRLIEASGGAAVMRMPSSPWLTSPTGLLQGGTIAMLADAAMQAAVVSTAPAATAVAALDLKVNFLRPAPPDGGQLTARAEVIHRGRKIAIARSDVANEDGKTVVAATGSSMYLPGRPAALGDVELSGERPD